MVLSEDIMYKASLEKDTSFEGTFFMAVKTTGIFCRPSCTARKPKRENVEFFSSAKEAMLKGYRPCKVCKPLETLNETPSNIRSVLEELSADPSLKFRDYDLRKRGMEPAQVRRWFQKHHGITFQAYQRIYRINHAFKRIQNGGTVADAAFNSGFESLSGFGDSFKNIFKVSPRKSKEQMIVDLKRIETPLGTMIACATEEGICLLEFTDRKMLETELKSLSKRLNATITIGENRHFAELGKQLNEYFEGTRKDFSIPLKVPGTEFQHKAWKQLQNIPYGETRSYAQQAKAIGQPDSVRAVANANGMNPVAIIVPCHRVIGSDGKLTGYGGGLWRKKFLLELEEKFSGKTLF